MESNPRASPADSEVWLGGELQYLEMEEMMGLCKYNWFHKEQHKAFQGGCLQPSGTSTVGMMAIMSAPMGQHMEPCGQQQTKVTPAVSVITLYRAQLDVMDVRLGSLCKEIQNQQNHICQP